MGIIAIGKFNFKVDSKSLIQRYVLKKELFSRLKRKLELGPYRIKLLGGEVKILFAWRHGGHNAVQNNEPVAILRPVYMEVGDLIWVR